MATRQQSRKESQLPPPKVEDNTLDEQHAGISPVDFPVTDNDHSTEGGQSHVAPASTNDRERRQKAESSRNSR